jgi:hypothetical protein
MCVCNGILSYEFFFKERFYEVVNFGTTGVLVQRFTGWYKNCVSELCTQIY